MSLGHCRVELINQHLHIEGIAFATDETFHSIGIHFEHMLGPVHGTFQTVLLGIQKPSNRIIAE